MPRIEVVHVRDPDAECEMLVFIDGVQFEPEVYDIDPGRGYMRTDWDETTEGEVAVATRPAAKVIRARRDMAADMSKYIKDDR